MYPFQVDGVPLVGIRSGAEVAGVLKAPLSYEAGASGEFDGRVACPAGKLVDVISREGKVRIAKGTCRILTIRSVPQ
jgi:hypothetical protein